ncbi:hypothetical protein HN865_04245 [Candidatus Woesearchaeota archaeon]|jgi:uncharacterized membrane protein|nr:hypothetical protein [Candidatus Woesearchaeota archaeon]MBT6995339.1 hypothetical protein [Candidatus Woesearchaeota archaeon]MBT7238038.1 hypothetical protein [Candidatus Woesearchaeota archaeon]
MEINNKKLIIGFGLVFLLGVAFSIVNGEYTDSTNEQLPLIVYAISFLSVIVGAFLVIMFQAKINKIQLERVLKILHREERVIVKILLDNNNSIEQNKLVVLSGFNKVQTFRITRKLEERGVIEKKHLGNTNLIILKI